MVQCARCHERRGLIKRPGDGQPYCAECFFAEVEAGVLECLRGLFQSGVLWRGMRVAIGASGGKDSTVLAYVLKLLNHSFDLGLQLFLLSVDEGIRGYRDDSLATVERNQRDYQLPLLVVSYAELFQGWTMDRIVPLTGLGANCSFCGVLRRTALELGARRLGVDAIATGHNADDLAETLLLNLVRGDLARLPHSVQAHTGGDSIADGNDNGDGDEGDVVAIPRIKPFKRLYEKEIVMYAYFRKLHYFSTECTYAPGAFRGHARSFVKDAERLHSDVIHNLLAVGDYLHDLSALHRVKEGVEDRKTRNIRLRIQKCARCQCMTSTHDPQSAALCKACQIVDALNAGEPMQVLSGNPKRNSSLGRKIKDKEAGCASSLRRDGEIL
jgi:cytoplasmic tRNA 2-thiolation protein 1